MQLNQQPKRKFDDYTAAAYPQGAVLDTDALQALSPQHPHHSHALGHPALAQYQLQQQHQLQQQLANRSLHQVPLQAPVRAYVGPDNGSSTSPPQPPVAGKEKKPRKKREKTEKVEKPRKSRKSKGKVEESKPKVLFRGSRFELWLETRFEEELLKLFSVPVLEFSANLVANGASSSSSSPSARAGSWAMARSGEERIYKEKWRKRYHVYSAEVADLVADDFNFHIRIKNASGDFMKLPFISPDKIPTSPVSSFSNYLSLLGGAHISPGDDHCGYPPGELAGEDACTLYEGSDVSYVLVGHLVGQPAAPAGLHPFNVSHAAAPPLTHLSSQHHNQHAAQQQQQQQHPSHHAAALHAVGGGYPPPPHHHHHPHQLPTDGNHP